MGEMERVNNLGRNSSLVSTLDGVSMDSTGVRKKNKFNDLLETNTELLHDENTSSDSPSENDSFTCSEYEYDAPYENNKQLDSSTPGGMVFRKLNNLSDSERLRTESSGGRGSLTTLNVSDDDLSGFASPPVRPPGRASSTGAPTSTLSWVSSKTSPSCQT